MSTEPDEPMFASTLCLAAAALSASDSTPHANWMGDLMPAIGNLSLLDLSLPGTHDSMTFDLSTRVSDGANDMPPWVSWLLHEIGPIIGVAKVGDFIKQQAQTQGLKMLRMAANDAIQQMGAKQCCQFGLCCGR